MWRRIEEEYLKNCIILTVKSDGRPVFVWDSMTTKLPGVYTGRTDLSNG